MSQFTEERNLSEVFKELQETKQQYVSINNEKLKNKKNHKYYKNIKFMFNNTFFTNISNTLKTSIIHRRITIIAILLIVAISILMINTISSSYAKETTFTPEIETDKFSEFETNHNSLSMEQIISGNINSIKSKEIVTEDRDINFEITKKENSLLPKDEEVIVTTGIVGKENVTAIKIYENGEFTEETILERTVLTEPSAQIVDVGTSEYLAKYKVHINDQMYLTNTSTLKKSTTSDSESICEIKQYLNVTLIGLEGDYCKVSFNNSEGYLKNTLLTSASLSPEIVEKNRIQKLLSSLAITMPLNTPSGLTLEDYKKVLSNNSSDVNKIIYNNYANFYNIEKSYNVNGIFLAAVAIHESAWGTSAISNDKKNLFGYGACDSDPYNSAFEFDDYKDGIELVAKIFSKYYLNPANTKIYNSELATGAYYYGSTLEAVNTKYSTDSSWHTKVFKYMSYLYNKL